MMNASLTSSAKAALPAHAIATSLTALNRLIVFRILFLPVFDAPAASFDGGVLRSRQTETQSPPPKLVDAAALP